jgi:hypothetical protein
MADDEAPPPFSQPFKQLLPQAFPRSRISLLLHRRLSDKRIDWQPSLTRLRASIQRSQISLKAGEEWTQAQDNRGVRVSGTVAEKRGDYRASQLRSRRLLEARLKQTW